ncbi:MAG: hypothetical protein EXR55_07165 [Dehalococcoidia bacterium]|nr:hypothetical protein [Dehalococcoidia bacterium]
MPHPLSDLRVIDLTHGITGPYCTKLLADFGANVIKVEWPGAGDRSRAMGPFPGDVPHTEIGTHRYTSTAFKMSKVPFLVRKPPVMLRKDNDYVYRQVLKLSEAEYDRLKALGQIGMDYAPHIK